MANKPKTWLDRIAVPTLGAIIGLYWSFALWMSWNLLLGDVFVELTYSAACAITLPVWIFLPSTKEAADIIAEAELENRPELKEEYRHYKGPHLFMLFLFKPTSVIIVSFLLDQLL